MSNQTFNPYYADYKVIRADIKRALKEVEAKYGFTAELGRITYDNTGFRGKFTATKAVASSTNPERSLPPEHVVFNTICAQYGLKPEFLNRYFTSNGTQYRLIGAKAGQRKYPFLVEGPSGGRYKGSVAMVKRGFGIPTSPWDR